MLFLSVAVFLQAHLGRGRKASRCHFSLVARCWATPGSAGMSGHIQSVCVWIGPWNTLLHLSPDARKFCLHSADTEARVIRKCMLPLRANPFYFYHDFKGLASLAFSLKGGTLCFVRQRCQSCQSWLGCASYNVTHSASIQGRDAFFPQARLLLEQICGFCWSACALEEFPS